MFVAVFLLSQVGGVPLSVLATLVAVGVGTLVVVAGPSAIRGVFDRDRTPTEGEDEPPDWWLATLEPALEDTWNRWSDLVLVFGLAGIGVGSFALLVVAVGDDPHSGLLVTGFIGVTGAMITFPFLFRDSWA